MGLVPFSLVSPKIFTTYEISEYIIIFHDDFENFREMRMTIGQKEKILDLDCRVLDKNGNYLNGGRTNKKNSTLKVSMVCFTKGGKLNEFIFKKIRIRGKKKK